jgi:hypothetical protein
MRHVIILAAAVAASTPAASMTSQTPSTRNQKAAPIVEVIGCVSNGPNGTWVLTNGTEPAVSKVPNTTTAAVKEAEGKRLGRRRYRLLGVAPFGPENHKGRKVVVKGVLIEAANNDRINVTSLQITGAPCGSK